MEFDPCKATLGGMSHYNNYMKIANYVASYNMYGFWKKPYGFWVDIIRKYSWSDDVDFTRHRSSVDILSKSVSQCVGR